MSPQMARWLSPDPATKGPDPNHLKEPWDMNPYLFVRQNPTTYWDPNGENWFKIGHHYEWHEGSKFHGETSNYHYLVRFRAEMSSPDGKRVEGRLQLFGNSEKPLVDVEGAFSGGFGAGRARKDHISPGTYTIRNKISYARGEEDLKPAPYGTPVSRRELLPRDGIEILENITDKEGNVMTFKNEWGHIRAHLRPDADNHGKQTQGVWLHGKDDYEVDVTHGCLCDRTETVTNALKNMSESERKANPVIPAEVQ